MLSTHSLLKVSAGRMDDVAKLIKFLPGGKKASVWDHYTMRSRTRTTQPKASVSSDNGAVQGTAGSLEIVTAGEENQGSWDAAAE